MSGIRTLDSGFKVNDLRNQNIEWTMHTIFGVSMAYNIRC